jgi:CheY-like chemotaxis protein
MKILILDDNKHRHDVFAARFADDERVHCYSYSQAIAALSDSFDVIFLDHDLGEFHTPDTWESYGGKMIEYTGLDVAKAVADHYRGWAGIDDLPRVVIHSVNPVGAPVMRDVLQDCGFSVVWDPFSDDSKCEDCFGDGFNMGLNGPEICGICHGVGRK